LLDREFFDVAAKSDHPVSRAELKLMLQSLLADRFKLAMHHESKTEAVYKLSVASSGPKLPASASEGEPVCNGRIDGGVICRNMSMAAFSNFLTPRLSRTVLDTTGLEGRYDFDLKLDGLPTAAQVREAAASGGEAANAVKRSMFDWTQSSIFSDIQKQLGLKLDADRAPVDNLVIDHVERPSEN